MSRTWINFLLDSLLLVAFLALVWCSVVLRFVFPPALDTRGWMLWGATYEQWFRLQFLLVALLTLLVLVHVMLHWSWVCGVLAQRFSRDKKNRPDDGSRTLYGVGLLIGLLIGMGLCVMAAALSMVRPHS